MYMNFWYPVAASENVTNEAPLRVRILSLDFVAFRDQAGAARELPSIGVPIYWAMCVAMPL